MMVVLEFSCNWEDWSYLCHHLDQKFYVSQSDYKIQKVENKVSKFQTKNIA